MRRAESTFCLQCWHVHSLHFLSRRADRLAGVCHDLISAFRFGGVERSVRKFQQFTRMTILATPGGYADADRYAKPTLPDIERLFSDFPAQSLAFSFPKEQCNPGQRP
jgi:hypothetical protein